MGLLKKEELQVIDFNKIDVKKLPELANIKKEVNKIVKENPYTAITDTKSYDLAKERRTKLRTTRTTYEKQDKTFATLFSNIRKSIGSVIKTEVIDIVTPHEDKQQEEITRWENIKEEERKERERKAQEREDKITASIDAHGVDIDALLDQMKYETISETKTKIDEIAGKYKGTFAEFDVIFDKVVSNAENRFDDLEQSLTEAYNQAEENRKHGLLNDISGKRNAVNQILLEADFDTVQNIMPAVEKLFLYVDKFSEYKTEFSDAKTDALNLANARIEKINQDEADRLELIELRTIKLLKDRHKILISEGFTENAEAGTYTKNEVVYFIDAMVEDSEEMFNYHIQEANQPEAVAEIETVSETADHQISNTDNADIPTENAVVHTEEAYTAEEKPVTDQVTDRAGQLSELGLRFDFNTTYKGFGFFIDSLDILTYDNEKWDKLITQITERSNKMPEAVAEPDFTAVQKLISNYIAELYKPKDERDVFGIKEDVFQQAMVAIYGDTVLDFIYLKTK